MFLNTKQHTPTNLDNLVGPDNRTQLQKLGNQLSAAFFRKLQQLAAFEPAGCGLGTPAPKPVPT